jgi:hypothetical protein
VVETDQTLLGLITGKIKTDVPVEKP